MNAARLPDGGLYAEDGVITQVGPSADLPATADTVIDAPDRILIPGLVNTHHHLYQSLTRVVPARPKRQSLQLAENALSHLGRADPGGRLHLGQSRPGRDDADRLHHLLRPSLHVPQRQPHRRRDRGRGRVGHSLPRRPRLHEPGRERMAGCRPTAWSKTKTSSSRDCRRADRDLSIRPSATAWCGSCSRPARPSPSRPT